LNRRGFDDPGAKFRGWRRRVTGHGDSTTVRDEIVHYEDWVARGS